MPLSRSPSADSIYTLRNRNIQPQGVTPLPQTTFSNVATTVATTTTQAMTTHTGAVPKYSQLPSEDATQEKKSTTIFETPKRSSNLEYTIPEIQSYGSEEDKVQQFKTVSHTENLEKTRIPVFQDADTQTSQQQAPTGTHTNDDIIHMLAQATAVNSSLIHTLNDRVENLTMSDVLRPNYSQLLTKIPSTDGSSPDLVVEFIIEMDEISKLEIIPFQNLLKSVMMIVQGELRSFLAVCAKDISTWILLKRKILKTFLTRQQINRITLSRIFRYQKPDETFTDFAQDVHRVACALESVDNDSILAHIWDNCNAEYLQLILHIPIPQTFQELLTIAKRLEDARQRMKLAQQRDIESKPTTKNSSTSRM